MRKQKEKEIKLMLRRMAAAMNMPLPARLLMTKFMDLRMLTEDQVDQTHAGLKQMIERMDPSEIAAILERAKTMQN